MAVASKKAKAKADQPKVIPALALYQQQGCTLMAFKQALAHTALTTKKKRRM